MSKLPCWLSLIAKFLVVDVDIALFIAVWSWMTYDPFRSDRGAIRTTRLI